MTLTSHAIAGAAVATIVPKNPVLGFVFGFLSHFLLDAFPHGHYPIPSHTRNPENRLQEDMVYGRQFMLDLIKIGADSLLGAVLVYLFFISGGQGIRLNILWGAFGGILPDALQFLYWKIRVEPLTSLQKFHISNHASGHFNHDLAKMVTVELLAIILALTFARVFGL